MLKITKDNYKEYTSIGSDDEFDSVLNMCLAKQKTRYIRNLLSVNTTYVELESDGFLVGLDNDDTW